MSKTIDFYDNNAETFVAGTINADVTYIQDRFLRLLPEGARILDFGCGSGRDTKYFLEKGFRAEGVDGSKELCRIASENTGTTVRQMMFDELDEVNAYDGIWACSSILHLPKSELKEVLRKMVRAVKTGGYIYTSFRHGDFEGYINERYFTYFTEEGFEEFVGDINEIKTVDKWVSEDVRPDRREMKWLNLILRKLNTV
ncbi:MAG: class I SAM-dependent methyltransferase [Lachnospiraceae bacterium]|nr:class I SAM-dependent methyltransferase [Lachnospiraceae bacterium]